MICGGLNWCLAYSQRARGLLGTLTVLYVTIVAISTAGYETAADGILGP
jgi:hypothetical protein